VKPEIPQELLENAAAFSEALATVQASVRSLVRSGAKPAPGPWVLNKESLSEPVPAIASHRASAEAACVELRSLMDGADVRALRREGLYRAARGKRRENVARFRMLVDELATSARQAREECQARLHNGADWTQAQRLMRVQGSLRRSVFLLRAIHLLYRLHCQPASPIGHVLNSLEEALAALRAMGVRGAPVIPIRA
jgi:hypothetical protein